MKTIISGHSHRKSIKPSSYSVFSEWDGTKNYLKYFTFHLEGDRKSRPEYRINVKPKRPGVIPCKE